MESQTPESPEEKNGRNGFDLRAVVSLLKSIKLAVVLLTAITIACIVGTLIQQDSGMQPQQGVYAVLAKLGLTDLYHSWWFLTMLTMLLLNIVVCVFSRLRWLMRRPGMLLVHISAIFIAAGGMIGAFWGEKGFMVLREGESKDLFESRTGNVTRRFPLGFTVGLDDFILERYESGSGKMVLVKEQGRDEVASIPAEPGHLHEVFGGRYSVEVLKVVPDFRMDTNSGEITSASDNFNNPAIQLKIVQDDKEEIRWLFAKFPNFHEPKDALPLDAQFSFGGSGQIKDYKSALWVEDGGERVITKTIEVNDPLIYKGYHFYQSSYDDQNLSWTGLQVVKDPGVPLVYIGFAMLCLGTVIDLYPRSWKTNGQKKG